MSVKFLTEEELLQRVRDAVWDRNVRRLREIQAVNKAYRILIRLEEEKNTKASTGVDLSSMPTWLID